MTVIGLTGPTGAGKSVVADIFRENGALIIDTDRIAREIVEPQSTCLAALKSAFGKDILNPDGSLDRAALAKKAFASKESQQLLNSITHPAIIARSRDILSLSDAAVAVIDAPLLFESGMDTLCDVTVAVLAPKETRLSRIMKRDGIAEERALERINIQPDDEFYRSRATHTLINDGDTKALFEKIYGIYRCLVQEVD